MYIFESDLSSRFITLLEMSLGKNNITLAKDKVHLRDLLTSNANSVCFLRIVNKDDNDYYEQLNSLYGVNRVYTLNCLQYFA